MTKASRQPTSAANRPCRAGRWRRGRPPRGAEPVTAVDDQVDPAPARAGIISSIAELIAAYSPPIPAPVKKRAAKKYQGGKEKAVATVASDVDAESVIRNSFLRPKRSVSWPKKQRADAGAGDVDRLRAVRSGPR